jgi:hypothetical protein
VEAGRSERDESQRTSTLRELALKEVSSVIRNEDLVRLRLVDVVSPVAGMCPGARSFGPHVHQRSTGAEPLADGRRCCQGSHISGDPSKGYGISAHSGGSLSGSAVASEAQ